MPKIKTTKHFIERVESRFNTNNYKPLEYVINTFLTWYKKMKKKKQFFSKKEKDWKIKIYIWEFAYVYSEQNWEVTLITFWVRSKE